MPVLDAGGGVRLAYETAGGEGSPVLLIMGLGLPGAAWVRQVEALAPHHRVACFDNRGVGSTVAPPGPYRVEELAADARALLDHLGWADAHLAGISMGGMIAQQLALTARQRVRSLVLIATSGRGLGWRLSLAGLRLGLKVVFGRGKGRLRALGRQLISPQRLAEAGAEEMARQMAARVGPLPPASAFLAQYAAVVRFRSEDRLDELAGLPTLVIQPGRDLVIDPGESERLAAQIPGARLVRFPGSGHGVIAEEAEGVNRLLLEHFRSADEARARRAPAAAASRRTSSST
jgi:pimeloyl-ACP methyl ester carboxylesterase